MTMQPDNKNQRCDKFPETSEWSVHTERENATIPTIQINRHDVYYIVVVL